MSLYIRDPEVNALASRLQVALGARTKTEAVRLALEHELDRHAAARSFDQRNADVMSMADALGPPATAFDFKAFSDEMWDG